MFTSVDIFVLVFTFIAFIINVVYVSKLYSEVEDMYQIMSETLMQDLEMAMSVDKEMDEMYEKIEKLTRKECGCKKEVELSDMQ